MKPLLTKTLLGSTILLSSILLSSCESESLNTDSILESNNTSDISIVAESESLWQNSTITYTYDPNFTNRTDFEAAVHHWELCNTLKFVEATNPVDTDLIVLRSSSGFCTATVGYRGNLAHSNSISISNSCEVDEIIHELGHVSGMYHEHNRNDRDEHVIVNFENIQEAAHFQFTKNEDKGNNSLEFGPFDFDSIMLYPSDLFALDPSAPSMVRTNGSTFERSTVLSEYDILGIESVYRDGSPKTIAISALINGGRYFSSENGRQDITTTRTAIGRWERFTVHPIGGGLIALQGNNRRFLSVDDTGALRFSANRIGDSETFKFTYNTTLNGKLYYNISHEDFSDLYVNDFTNEIRIDNSGGGGQDSLFSVEIFN